VPIGEAKRWSGLQGDGTEVGSDQGSRSAEVERDGRFGRKLLLAVFVLGAAMVHVRPASAIPVFAYIYGKPCSTCHTVYPQLNPEGERFRAKGLHGLEPVVEPIPISSQLAIPGTLPLAISAGVGEDLSGTARHDQTDAFAQHLNLEFLSLLGGAELGPHLAFLADYAPLFGNPRTGETTTNSRLGLGFLQAHAEPWGWLGNLRVGLEELPLGSSPRVHRLSNTPYLIYQVTPASLLAAKPPVTGPRTNSLILGSTQYAVEASALDPDGGLGAFVGGSLGSNNQDDFNATQDFFLRVEQEFFGLHKAGFFLYYSPDALGSGVHDQALRLGPDLTLYWRRARIATQFLAGWDSNPTGRHVDFWYYGGFAEGEYRLTPSVLALARLDSVGAPKFNDTAQGGQVKYQPLLWDVTAGLQWLLDENFKVLVEATYGQTFVAPGHTASGSISRQAPESWLVTMQLRAAFFPLRPPFYRWFTGQSPPEAGT
jgi:hypothetical protein